MQMTKSGALERRATRLVFLLCGMAHSSWAPLVPYAKGFGVAYLLVLVALSGSIAVPSQEQIPLLEESAAVDKSWR